ncbi:hypothetical protein RIVM261_042650 [Rivularia sp. IAM M-261]|nr:hypothetical protein RIVM261_042650 [Rivularia sp. IAM M-261]
MIILNSSLRRIFLLIKLIVIGLVALLLMGLISLNQPVFAEVTKFEQPEEIIYRSQHSLSDQSGHTWQVIMFKSVRPGAQDNIPLLYLRVIGLPGAAEVGHPMQLKITTNTGKIFTAADIFLEEAPAPTVGQYNLQDLDADMLRDEVLLSIPLPGSRYVNLEIPQSVVREWQEVVNQAVRS